MVMRLPQHKHCLNCDEPIPEDKDYCSEECMVKNKIKQKQSSRKMTYFYILAAVALVVVWAFTMFLK